MLFVFLSALVFGCVRAFFYFKKNQHRLKNKETLIILIFLVFAMISVIIVVRVVLLYLFLIAYIWIFAVLVADIFRYLRRNPLIRKWRILFYFLAIAGIGIGYCVSTDMDMVYTFSKKLKVGGFPFPLVIFEYEASEGIEAVFSKMMPRVMETLIY